MTLTYLLLALLATLLALGVFLAYAVPRWAIGAAWRPWRGWRS